jgi:hypothetical protein
MQAQLREEAYKLREDFWAEADDDVMRYRGGFFLIGDLHIIGVVQMFALPCTLQLILKPLWVDSLKHIFSGIFPVPRDHV